MMFGLGELKKEMKYYSADNPLRINQKVLISLGVPDGCCTYCGRRINKIIGHQYQLTIDHVIPKSNGGSIHSANRVPCCKTCNSTKKDDSLEYFLTTIERCLHLNYGNSHNSLKRWRTTHSHVTQMILLKTSFNYQRNTVKRMDEIKTVNTPQY